MSDIRTRYIDLDHGLDFVLLAPGLETDEGLETAVVISLFTDRRALESDTLPPGSSDRRGWWGDSRPPVQDDQIGSRLWLLTREKQLSGGLQRAREYAEEALQWLVDDGVAAALDVLATNPRDGLLALSVSIQRSGDAAPTLFRFETLWSNT